MPLTLQELLAWPPEIEDLATATRQAATSHTDSAGFYRSLAKVSSWEGEGADAAMAAMEAHAREHDASAENLGAAAGAMEHAHQGADEVADTIKDIANDAAAMPAVQINLSTNQVIPPNTDYLTDEAAAQVAAKIADLQARIAAVLSAGEGVDADLAQAIRTASTTDTAATSAPGQIGPFAVPPSVGAKRSDDARDSPDSLDGALEQLAGAPVPASAGDAAAGAAPVSVRLDPAKVEQFKALARQAMQRDGVPADQIEARLDAMVAAAQRPLPAFKPTEPEAGPRPSFSDGFADGWFNTEEAIRDLVGANGWEEFKDSWTDTGKGVWERITNPIDSLTAEVEHATKYPGHYLGEIAGETAATAPAAIFGGEAALAARAGAGALDDLAAAGAHAHTAIPNDLVDTPTPAGTIDQPTPAPLVDTPSHHGTPGPVLEPSPLTPDSLLSDGYDPPPPGLDATKPDSELIYPDQSLPSKPYAVPGTVIDNVDIPQGTVLDRFGYPGGAWLSPEGVPFAERSLPDESAAKPYYKYVVDDPSKLPPEWRIEQSQAAPWFNQPGGGTQYRIIAPEGDEASVEALIDWGFLREVR